MNGKRARSLRKRVFVEGKEVLPRSYRITLDGQIQCFSNRVEYQRLKKERK